MLPIVCGMARGQASEGRKYLVSLPSFKLGGSEGVVAFECHLRSAMISQLNQIPEGWSYQLDNDNGDMSSLRANAIVYVAAFRDSSYFKDFMVIEQNHLENSSAGPPFKMDCRIEIEPTVKETNRYINVSASNITLKPLQP